MEGESSQELERFDPPKSESAPWLVFVPNHEYNKRSKKSNMVLSQTFYAISEKKSYVKNIDGVGGHNWWSTPQGWMFMQEPKSKKCCLWNPIKAVKISVPPCKWNFSSDANCAISSSSLETSKSCKLMCLDNGGRSLFVYDVETSKWERHDIKEMQLREVFVLNGQLYCLTSSFKLAVIDLIPNLQVRGVDQDGLPWHDRFARIAESCEYYLESSGEIFGVEVCFGAADSKTAIRVIVYRKDCSDGTWNAVDQIGDNAFFLGPSRFGASYPANGINIKGNCIYFLYLGECCMYVFDMIEGTIQVDAPCPEFLHRATSTSLQWIVPPK